jgi:hypothetical protein
MPVTRGWSPYAWVSVQREEERVKHVGYIGIRCHLQDHQRRRDQIAIECNNRGSEILGHQLVWLENLALRIQQDPYTRSWYYHTKWTHSPESTFFSLKIAQAFSQLKL